MARIAGDRHIRWKFHKVLVDYYKLQPPEFKALCRDVGRPYGYTGHNVFRQFIKKQLLETHPDYEYRAWIKKIL